MRRLAFASVLLLLACVVAPVMAQGAVAYSQPPNPAGGLYLSSWYDPDGTDFDAWVWDRFAVASNLSITEVRWRGGFDPVQLGSGGAVLDFTVAIWASGPSGSQPDVTNPPLVRYHTGGNAGETAAGTFGGVAMFDYAFVLPTAFLATAGVGYWVQIEAYQHGIPDWGIAAGTGGDGQHFREISHRFYQTLPGDAAFTLLTPDLPPTQTPTPTLAATAAPTVAPTPTATALPPIYRVYLPLMLKRF